MKTIKEESQVGILDKETGEIIKIYPHMVKGDFDKISDTVREWYFNQECENEDRFKDYVIDIID